MKDVPVVVGMECIKLGDIDDNSPWRMTVDVFEDGVQRRLQLVGAHYNGWPTPPDPLTVKEMAKVWTGRERPAEEIAAELYAANERYVAAVQEAANTMYREQVRIIHGERGLQFLDREDREEEE